MHETTVRFTNGLWAEVRAASKRERISAAQFVRDATVARISGEERVRLLRTELEAALRAPVERVQRIEDAMRRHGLR